MNYPDPYVFKYSRKYPFITKIICIWISISLNTMDFSLAFPIGESTSPITGRFGEEEHDQFIDQQRFKRLNAKEQYFEKKQRQLEDLRKKGEVQNRNIIQINQEHGRRIEQDYQKRIESYQKDKKEADDTTNKISRYGKYYILQWPDKHGRIEADWYFRTLPYKILNKLNIDRFGRETYTDTTGIAPEEGMQYGLFDSKWKLTDYMERTTNMLGIVDIRMFMHGDYYTASDETTDPSRYEGELKSYEEIVYNNYYSDTEYSNRKKTIRDEIYYYTENDEKSDQAHPDKQMKSYHDTVYVASQAMSELFVTDMLYETRERLTNPYEDAEQTLKEDDDVHLLVSYNQVSLSQDIKTDSQWKGEYDDEQRIKGTFESGCNNLEECFREQTTQIQYDDKTGIIIHFIRVRQETTPFGSTLTRTVRNPIYHGEELVQVRETYSVSGNDVETQYQASGTRIYDIFKGIELFTKEESEYVYHDDKVYTTDEEGNLILDDPKESKTIRTSTEYHYDDKGLPVNALGLRDTIVTQIINGNPILISEAHALIHYQIINNAFQMAKVEEQSIQYNGMYYTTNLETGELELVKDPSYRISRSIQEYTYEHTEDYTVLSGVDGSAVSARYDYIEGQWHLMEESYSVSEYIIEYGRNYLVKDTNTATIYGPPVYTEDDEGNLILIESPSVRKVITTTNYIYKDGRLRGANGTSSTTIYTRVNGILVVEAVGSGLIQYEIILGQARVVRQDEQMDYNQHKVYHTDPVTGELILKDDDQSRRVAKTTSFRYDRSGRLMESQETSNTEYYQYYENVRHLIGRGSSENVYQIYKGLAQLMTSVETSEMLYLTGASSYSENILIYEREALTGYLVGGHGQTHNISTQVDIHGDIIGQTRTQTLDQHLVLRGQLQLKVREVSTFTENLDGSVANGNTYTAYTYSQDGLLIGASGYETGSSNSFVYENDETFIPVEWSQTTSQSDLTYRILSGTAVVTKKNSSSHTDNLDGSVVESNMETLNTYDEEGRLMGSVVEGSNTSTNLVYADDEDYELAPIVTRSIVKEQFMMQNGQALRKESENRSETDVPAPDFLYPENRSETFTTYQYNALGQLESALLWGSNFSNDGFDNITIGKTTNLMQIILGQAKAVQTDNTSTTTSRDGTISVQNNQSTNVYDELGFLISGSTGATIISTDVYGTDTATTSTEMLKLY
ncbi:MAG: hypothetical protein Q8Q33_04555, partial [Chlamydiota bacterium]|nr:hypothetical protein [Chlamydiota bacterium]